MIQITMNFNSLKEARNALAAITDEGSRLPSTSSKPASGSSEPDEVNATQTAIALAEENNLTLDGIQGTGKDGRITKTDVQGVLAKAANAEDEDEDDSEPEPAQAPQDEPEPSQAAQEPAEPATPDEPTQQDALAAMKALSEAKSIDACREVLHEFDAERLGELPEDKYPDFINRCRDKAAE